MTQNKKLFIFSALFALGFSVCAQDFENGFGFNLPYDDTATVEYLPVFANGPITGADRVTTDSAGSFLVRGTPYRFYGGNLTTRAAFPRKSDAALVAGRMRKYGINLVRFHHIDNPWSDGSLFHETGGTRELNAELLDRLDYFIFQLKQHGIYVNMNLNVSRTFEAVDGVVHADSLSDYAKGLTQFDPRMIALQKEYAGKLLGHVNPYTGTTLATDPVLAMLEIINENSLFRMWYSGALKPISRGGKLPLYYNDQLDSLWHDYLGEKYESTDSLEVAWNRNRLTGDTLFFDGFENGISGEWIMELHSTAAATMQVTPDAATGNSATRVSVTSGSTETWHTQFKNVGRSVRKDSIYEIVFKAMADSAMEISIAIMRDNSPWTWYTGQDYLLDTVWREYKLSFGAPEDNTGSLRIGFSFNHNLGDFYFDDVLLKTETNSGLGEMESIEAESVNRLEYNDFRSYTRERIMDQTAFYALVQVDFLNEMSGFLRDSLGVAAPMTGTNWFTGAEDVYVQNTLDYVDNHAYWDHPSFPGQPWSPTDWTINNTPMLASGSGTIPNLFNGLMIRGKPYTVSEYNHAFPNQFQGELLPLITAYLSYNDADGFMVFTYSGSWDWEANRVDGYFDIHRNSNLMGNFPLFSYAFRNYLIGADPTPLLLEFSRNDILEMPLIMENWWSTHFPYNSQLGLVNRMEVSFDNHTDFDAGRLPAPPASPFSLDNDQVFWDKAGIFIIDTEKFISICGNLDSYGNPSTGRLKVNSADGFGSVNWLTLADSAVDHSSRSILAIGSKMMNTGMIWEGTSTVHNNWGGEPALVFPVNPVIRLKTSFSHMRITPLDELGRLVAESADTIAADTSGFVTVQLDQTGDGTLWYGIEALNHKEPVEVVDTTLLVQKRGTGRLKCYPVPADGTLYFEVDNGTGHNMDLSIFDLTGARVYSRQFKEKVVVDTSGFPPGTYYYLLRNQTGLLRGKVILAH